MALDLSAIEKPRDDELLVVVGPTASGKTELALRLCERFDGEVVGADSVQIYRGFDVGSGKPSAEEQRRARHHLVDVLDALESVDAQRFAELGEAAIADIRARGKVPVICGGTFLWVKALVWGLSNLPAGNAEIRAAHQAFAEAHGRAALHEKLSRVDAESAKKLSPNDFVRVSRALEVFELSGRPQSEILAGHGFKARRHEAVFVGADRERDELDIRIEQRAAMWLASGWKEEVRSLIERGYREARAMGSVGYRQVLDHVEGRLPEEELLTAIVRATRVFVRRQRTWIRDLPMRWVALSR